MLKLTREPFFIDNRPITSVRLNGLELHDCSAACRICVGDFQLLAVATVYYAINLSVFVLDVLALLSVCFQSVISSFTICDYISVKTSEMAVCVYNPTEELSYIFPGALHP